MCVQSAHPAETHGTELADIFREYQHRLPFAGDEAWKVINAITACRTGKLGIHVWKCDNCEYTELAYNSCRNRHCPKCQSLAKARWILQRDRDLLPVSYFHLVFTIPTLFNGIALCNKRAVYDLLFNSVSKTLKAVVARPENLGAACGFFAILHTWDQKLNLHPHIHCVVPGGGLADGGARWISSRENFFVAVRKLSRVFRGVFLRGLEELFQRRQLEFKGKASTFAGRDTFKVLLIRSCRTEWVVYAKPPFRGAHWVLRYLARYTHRIAISNSRITGCRDGRVSFVWRDREHGYAKKTAVMDAVVFMQRFLLHVLPARFVRIRYYGFMANRVRRENITVIRGLLGEYSTPEEPVELPTGWVDTMIFLTGVNPLICRKCGTGRMQDVTCFMSLEQAGFG